MAYQDGYLVADSIEVFAKMDRLRILMDRSAKIGMSNGQRRGQAWFNALCDVAPELAELIRNTDEDPFNDDDRLPAFMQAIFGNAQFDY